VRVGGLVWIGRSLKLHTLVYVGPFHVAYGRVSQSPPTESTSFRKYEHSHHLLFLSMNATGLHCGDKKPKVYVADDRLLATVVIALTVIFA
jgi:hypothetical protein